MKNKRIIAVLAAALLLCSCGKAIEPAEEVFASVTTTSAEMTAAAETTAPEETTAAPETTTAPPETTTTETTTTTEEEATEPEESLPEDPEDRPPRTEAAVMLDTVLYDQLGGEYYSCVGCGPTSCAMIITSETDVDVTKDEAVEFAYERGYYYDAGWNFTSGFGVTQEDIQSLFNAYGFETEIDHLWTDSDTEILDKIGAVLDSGHRMVIGHCKPDGVLHYAVIYGKSQTDGMTYYNINDPWGGVDSLWSEDDLLDRLHWINGYDSTTINGLVKGIQWIKDQ